MSLSGIYFLENKNVLTRNSHMARYVQFLVNLTLKPFVIKTRWSWEREKEEDGHISLTLPPFVYLRVSWINLESICNNILPLTDAYGYTIYHFFLMKILRFMNDASLLISHCQKWRMNVACNYIFFWWIWFVTLGPHPTNGAHWLRHYRKPRQFPR